MDARAGLETRLGQVERRIAAMIRAIEDGLYQPAMKQRMIALETEKAQLQAEIAAKPATLPAASMRCWRGDLAQILAICAGAERANARRVRAGVLLLFLIVE